MLLQYLYAVVEGLPSGWRPPPPVIGERVERRTLGGLVLLSSAAAAAVPPATPTTLALHHDVVASALDAQGLLPFRYGTALRTGDVDGWLTRERPALDGALANVRGCVEMSVKLLRLDPTPAVAAVDAMRAAGEEVRLRELATQIVERAAVAQWRYRPAGSAGNVVASVAFLLPRGELADFLARIAPVASHAVGIAVVPTGPWPAYSFVPAFERPPLAPAASPTDRATDRRAG